MSSASTRNHVVPATSADPQTSGAGPSSSTASSSSSSQGRQWREVVASMRDMVRELDELVPPEEEEEDDDESRDRTADDDSNCRVTHEPRDVRTPPLPDSIARDVAVETTTAAAAASEEQAKKKKKRSSNKWQRILTITTFLATRAKKNHQKLNTAAAPPSSTPHPPPPAATHRVTADNIVPLRDDVAEEEEEVEAMHSKFPFNQFFSRSYSVEENTRTTPPPPPLHPNSSLAAAASRSPRLRPAAPAPGGHQRLRLTSSARDDYGGGDVGGFRCSYDDDDEDDDCEGAKDAFDQSDFFQSGRKCQSPSEESLRSGGGGGRYHHTHKLTHHLSSKRMNLRRIVSSERKLIAAVSSGALGSDPYGAGGKKQQLHSFRDSHSACTSPSCSAQHSPSYHDPPHSGGSDPATSPAGYEPEFSKKSKKSRFKRSFKSVSKQLSAPINNNEHLHYHPERTWTKKEGDCVWYNLSGQQVELESTELWKLSELECEALQKVALELICQLDLGVVVVVPKDESHGWKQKHKLKKKYASLMAKEKQQQKEKAFEHVFGIPLVQVVENDQLLRLQKSESFAPTMQKLSGSHVSAQAPAQQDQLLEQCSELSETGGVASSSLSEISTVYSAEGADSTSSFEKVEDGTILEGGDAESIPSRSSSVPHTPQVMRTNHNTSEPAFEATKQSGSSSGGGAETSTPPHSASSPNPATPGRPLRRRGAIGADSFQAIDPHQSQLLQALSLSVSGSGGAEGGGSGHERKEKASVLPPTMVQVPYVVQKCCDYITKFGLDVTGIFRIAGSKKRVRQLREEFDLGVDVTIEESYNPHDVAALLKEFFRDLPEALLTRELYPAFIQSTSLSGDTRMRVARYLVWLLPIPNRDSLRTLLRFLYNVAKHCEERTDERGAKVGGNLMTVYNLATIFGPNLLHRHKKPSSSSSSGSQSVEPAHLGVERMEDSGNVIKVVEHMINNHIALFEVSKESHDCILRKLKESEPEAVDFILRRKAANYKRERSAQNEQSRSQQESLNRASLPDVLTDIEDDVMVEGHVTSRDERVSDDEASDEEEEDDDRFGHRRYAPSSADSEKGSKDSKSESSPTSLSNIKDKPSMDEYEKENVEQSPPPQNNSSSSSSSSSSTDQAIKSKDFSYNTNKNNNKSKKNFETYI